MPRSSPRTSPLFLIPRPPRQRKPGPNSRRIGPAVARCHLPLWAFAVWQAHSHRQTAAGVRVCVRMHGSSPRLSLGSFCAWLQPQMREKSACQSVSFSQQYPLRGIVHSGLCPPACSGRPRAVLGCCLGPYGGARLLPAPAGPIFLSLAMFSAWAMSRKMGLGGR